MNKNSNISIYDAKSVITFFVGVMCVFLGMLIGHGQYIELDTFYTPWNHDDFMALSGFKYFLCTRQKQITY